MSGSGLDKGTSTDSGLDITLTDSSVSKMQTGSYLMKLERDLRKIIFLHLEVSYTKKNSHTTFLFNR